MAIINTNTVILSDSELPLGQTVISTYCTVMTTDKLGSVKASAQIGFFLTPEKMLESPTNKLKIKGFEGDKYRLEFDYPTNDNNVFYFFDLKIKEYLLSLFPEWDESKLVLTTEPIAE